ncbi:hypothetical protein TRICI_004618 [Trichomonascus ciferrii]|uniref:tRNA wybutosine-synthesizing protein 4 n=1 Tax=Trichomonascus ciferrii TaxID=44093 RepID=A0A642V0E1_9ASCO|nr:hypothetical protein TRICI_004618 [Trichomonascus ciferrii]
MGVNPKEKPLSTKGKDGRRKKKVELVDESIQGTNDSSIASKRSVETLYRRKGSTEPEFFKFFVPKKQRRSPNINRGYWTRVEAMTRSINNFAGTKFNGPKVVVNLGCGFDPYAFQHVYRYPNTDLVFVDVDYPDLMKRKLRIVENYPELANLIGERYRTDPSKQEILLHSRNYIALSCDLRKLERFSEVLKSIFPFGSSTFLFTAEVSLTYMVQKSADALIAWAGTLPNVRFALLEQIIPATENHPFARRMLNHFRSYGSPLNSVELYPRLEDQIARFKTRGWKKIHARDLTQFWSKEVTSEQKAFVSSVEDFDEWEEFIIFGQHYFILDAINEKYSSNEPHDDGKTSLNVDRANYVVDQTQLGFEDFNRKFSSGCLYNDHTMMVHGGMGDFRKDSCVFLSTEDNGAEISGKVPARMCHTATRLATGEILLVGGRTGPSKPLSDCWILRNFIWERVQDLPEPRYRHTAAALPNGDALIYGGKTTTATSPWLVWNKERGWEDINCGQLSCRLSAAFNWNQDSNTGILVGGMEADGTIKNDAFKVTFDLETRKLNVEKLFSSPLLARLGAKGLFLNDEVFLIAGGVSDDKLYDANNQLVELHFNSDVDIREVPIPQPMLLAGFNMDLIAENQLIFYGGGAVCYSFGSHWNGVWLLTFNNPNIHHALSKSLTKTSQY